MTFLLKKKCFWITKAHVAWLLKVRAKNSKIPKNEEENKKGLKDWLKPDRTKMEEFINRCCRLQSVIDRQNLKPGSVKPSSNVSCITCRLMYHMYLSVVRGLSNVSYITCSLMYHVPCTSQKFSNVSSIKLNVPCILSSMFYVSVRLTYSK